MKYLNFEFNVISQNFCEVVNVSDPFSDSTLESPSSIYFGTVVIIIFLSSSGNTKEITSKTSDTIDTRTETGIAPASNRPARTRIDIGYKHASVYIRPYRGSAVTSVFNTEVVNDPNLARGYIDRPRKRFEIRGVRQDTYQLDMFRNNPQSYQEIRYTRHLGEVGL
jgi:hypothetical protein